MNARRRRATAGSDSWVHATRPRSPQQLSSGTAMRGRCERVPGRRTLELVEMPRSSDTMEEGTIVAWLVPAARRSVKSRDGEGDADLRAPARWARSASSRCWRRRGRGRRADRGAGGRGTLGSSSRPGVTAAGTAPRPPQTRRLRSSTAFTKGSVAASTPSRRTDAGPCSQAATARGRSPWKSSSSRRR